MDYEQKYKEVLARAKKWYFAPNSDKLPTYANRIIEEIFPELKEPDDERIRKELIDFVKSRLAGFPQCEKYITWLEKQGEQKPASKFEPKFKVGDFIVNDYCRGYVVALTNDAYLLDTGQGIPFSCEHNIHLWTIEDAKDGDVLAEDSCIFIIQRLSGINAAAKTYCTLFNDGEFNDGTILYFDIDSTKPATKEQHDILFAKMKEAGYEWDKEKKELKKLEKQNEQKLILDKFDDLMLKDMIEFIESGWSGNGKSHLIYWLKSIKDRIK